MGGGASTPFSVLLAVSVPFFGTPQSLPTSATRLPHDCQLPPRPLWVKGPPSRFQKVRGVTAPFLCRTPAQGGEGSPTGFSPHLPPPPPAGVCIINLSLVDFILLKYSVTFKKRGSPAISGRSVGVGCGEEVQRRLGGGGGSATQEDL